MKTCSTLFKSKITLFFIGFTLIVFSNLFSGCNKEELPDDSDIELDEKQLHSDNTDSLPDIYYLYYKDSILLDSIIKPYKPGKYSCNTENFGIENNKLFLKTPNSLSKVNHNVMLTNIETKETYKVKLKIRCWIKDVYSLYSLQNKTAPQFIYTSGDTTYSIENGNLYYTSKKSIYKTFCSKLNLEDQMYNQMVSKYGLYAFRTGGKVYVSTNLKNWDLIYDGARGIKESMVIVKNRNGYELLFSEYTPGNVSVRHHVRSYNFNSKKSDIRKIFYTDNDFQKEGLYPFARHIHFFVQDYYSDLIFLGTGDSDLQSAIYYSEDGGITFKRMGGGSQRWRSLSVFLTKESIFWNMDATHTQYLIRLKRSDIEENVNNSKLTFFPLINNAHWCSEKITISDKKHNTDMFVMSSNSEGNLYDSNFRNYGIIIKNNEPVVYELFSKKALNKYSQWYPIGIDYNKNILYLDLETMKTAKYRVKLNDPKRNI